MQLFRKHVCLGPSLIAPGTAAAQVSDCGISTYTVRGTRAQPPAGLAFPGCLAAGAPPLARGLPLTASVIVLLVSDDVETLDTG